MAQLGVARVPKRPQSIEVRERVGEGTEWPTLGLEVHGSRVQAGHLVGRTEIECVRGRGCGTLGDDIGASQPTTQPTSGILRRHLDFGFGLLLRCSVAVPADQQKAKHILFDISGLDPPFGGPAARGSSACHRGPPQSRRSRGLGVRVMLLEHLWHRPGAGREASERQALVHRGQQGSRDVVAEEPEAAARHPWPNVEDERLHPALFSGVRASEGDSEQCLAHDHAKILRN
mmetsp:Transcript_113153/g.325337  ORF Transcript_113153/g.325337 Transcript_113153/m.325337 type:complete len:231 (+) Transcript_113153:1374-2066(+)